MKSLISSSCKFFICIIVFIVLLLSISVAGPLGSVVDDFEYNPANDPPTDHGWRVISGTGTVSTVAVFGRLAGEDNEGHVMHMASVSGRSYVLEFPDNFDLNISNPYFAASAKSDSSYVIELLIAVDKVGQGHGQRKDSRNITQNRRWH